MDYVKINSAGSLRFSNYGLLCGDNRTVLLHNGEFFKIEDKSYLLPLKINRPVRIHFDKYDIYFSPDGVYDVYLGKNKYDDGFFSSYTLEDVLNGLKHKRRK
jgi:hypothetical protein